MAILARGDRERTARGGVPMAVTLTAPRGLVRATLEREGRRAGEIAIVLTRDPEIRALNRRWRGIDRATDVLSFGYDAAAPGGKGPCRAPAICGDLVISLERMHEQAKRYRVTPGRELARLAVHGALHLAGLDHQRPAERMHMRR